MARELLLWPLGKSAQALAYCDLADAAYAALTGDPNDATFAYRSRFDRFGQQVTPYFGPTGFEWNGVGVAEPAHCLVARADAVLVTRVDDPPVEEE